ncbi:carboxypeptidase regulatory-like domain-containing protein [Mariniblastus fucicola]|uniref:carboxypeptidase regulatory-like domain-containing protein n=1 Tax=Mariniblastus fucicola TaxID=980251 RepID=UPI0011DF65C4|nr:carboxypeptidase regulatory-like domain-containing protein [Mariniblastus fucicola]
MSRAFRNASVFCLLLFIVPMIGCGDPGPPTGDLSGTVYFNDEIVGDCRVMVYSQNTKRWLGAKVDLEGKFKITEVPTGEYQVAVGQRTTNAATEEPFDERIPKPFRDVETSGFVVAVEEGENTISLKMSK